MKIDFKLERRIGALSEYPSGYTKELNVNFVSLLAQAQKMKST